MGNKNNWEGIKKKIWDINKSYDYNPSIEDYDVSVNLTEITNLVESIQKEAYREGFKAAEEKFNTKKPSIGEVRITPINFSDLTKDENMGNSYETNLTLSKDLDEAIRQINNQIYNLEEQKELLENIKLNNSLYNVKIDEILWHKICKTPLKYNEKGLSRILQKVFPDAKDFYIEGHFLTFYLNGFHCGISIDESYDMVIFKTGTPNLQYLLNRRDTVVNRLYETASILNTFRNGKILNNVKLVLKTEIIDEKDWKNYFDTNMIHNNLEANEISGYDR